MRLEKNKEFFKIIGAGFITIFLLTGALTGSVIGLDKADPGEPEKTTSLCYSLPFEEPGLTAIVVDNRVFTEINMDSCLSIAENSGEPALPIYPVKILLPFGTELGDVRVSGRSIELDTRDVNLREHPVFPYQASVPIGSEGEKPSFVMNTETYDSRVKVPQELYDVIGVDFCRGYSILTLNVYPVSYLPRYGQLFYYPEVVVDIEVIQSGYVNQFFRNIFEDKAWVEDLVINPELSETYGGRSLPFDYPGGICDPADDYDYVIITRQSLMDFTAAYNWDDLIALRQSEGLSATKVAVETITSHPDYENPYPFNDDQAKIREFCKDAYQDWGTQYVLIAGDHEGVAAIPRRLMDTNYEGNIESDLYWSNLDNTFNDDGDNDWGEEGDSGFDLYSELFIGSLPCDEAIDISNWLTKNFYYANSYEQDYLENAAFYGGDTGWSCQGDDFIDFTYYGTDNWMGPDPDHDGPWPDFLGYLYGFDDWNIMHPGAEFNTSVKWTAEPPNPGWQGGSESAAIAGFKNAINNDHVTQIYGIAHANSGMSLDVYDSSWESQYHNTKPFFIHDFGCHCGDMSASDDGVLHSMLFHDDTELAFACVYNTCYGWGNLYCTNSSSALQQKLFVDYMFNESKCGGTQNWQLGRIQAATKDQMAPTILWDYSYGTFRAIIQGCLLFGDPAQTLKPPLLPEHNIVVQSLDVPSHVIPDQEVYVNATLFNNGLNDEINVIVSFRVDGTEIDSITIPSFESLTSQDVSFTWTPSLGWYTVTINETIPGITENVTIDNEKSQIVVAGPDVAVISATIPAYAGIESFATIEASVMNYGAQNEFVDISLKVNSIVIDTITILIGSGTFQVVTFLWNPTLEGLNAIDIEASVPNEVYPSNNIQSGESNVVAAKGFVLLVDDDEGDDYETYYQDALLASGYIYDYWDRDAQGCPTATEMSQYSAVVWFTGDDSSTTLVTEDQNALSTYLDSGGRLFVTGQDIGYDIRTTSFYSDYLHANYGVDDTNIVDLDGITGDPIGDGMYITITSGDGANNQAWPSGITAISPATEVFQYHNGVYYGGIKTDTGTYRVVYFSFGFEGINTMWDRAEVMNRTINWLATGGTYTLPDLTFDPINLDYQAAPGTIISDTLTIGNHVDATSHLIFNFVNIPSGVTISPSSGDLAPGDTLSLDLTIDTNYMTGNFTHFFLDLETNDPDESFVAIPVYVSIGLYQEFSIPIYAQWNLITVPNSMYWTAEDFGQNIDGTTVVCMFNAETQTFTTHVVGIPYNDFPILDGVGYFIYTTSDTTFTTVGAPVTDVSVPLYIGWNMIGWYHDYNTTAESLGQSIDSCTVITMFDAETQTFTTHVIGKIFNNYEITAGMGLYVYVTEQSIWNG